MIPDWVLGYVGIPWGEGGRTREACDCFGLLRLVLGEHFGVELPSYAGDYTMPLERDEVAALMQARIAVDAWRPVTTPRAGDGALFRVLGEPWHVGVVVGREHFLHVSPAANPSLIERLASPRWHRRLVGLSRPEALA